MALYRLQVIIPMDDNLPANSATNTLHFSAADDGSELAAIETAMNTFYQNFNTHLSSLITPSTWTYKWFKMSDPLPRVPYRTTTGQGALATGTTAAPPEVAMCLSYKSAQVSGFPVGRTRNRIYVGPLAQGALDTNGRPTSTAVTALRNSGNGLLTASAAAGWTWVTYSPTAAAAGTSTGIFDVISGWVDNEFDTQRRRGRAATSRTVFP
jgi:hypothetical protein